jgi:hypothetical protein
MSDPLIAEILKSVNALAAELRSHVGDEMSHIRAYNERAEERHSEIIALIATVNVVDALPKVDGKPDIHGHRNDHEVRKEAGITWRRRFDTITTAIMVMAATSTFGWAVFALWKAFLQGPVAK